MSTPLDEARDRLATFDELNAVVGAMRGIAASRVVMARNRLHAVRAHAATVGMAIGDTLALLPEERARVTTHGNSVGAALLVVLCSEQGFVGAFNERLVEAAKREDRQSGSSTATIIVGRRGESVALSRDMKPSEVLPMATRADAVPALALRLADRIGEHLATAEGSASVTLLHAQPGRSMAHAEPVRRALVPFDAARFTVRSHAVPPMTNLPAKYLLERLAGEYLFAELCQALMLAHAAENAARVQAMERARVNLERLIAEGGARYRRLRQHGVTAEVAELANGRLAARRRT